MRNRQLRTASNPTAAGVCRWRNHAALGWGSRATQRKAKDFGGPQIQTNPCGSKLQAQSCCIRSYRTEEIIPARTCMFQMESVDRFSLFSCETCEGHTGQVVSNQAGFPVMPILLARSCAKEGRWPEARTAPGKRVLQHILLRCTLGRYHNGRRRRSQLSVGPGRSLASLVRCLRFKEPSTQLKDTC